MSTEGEVVETPVGAESADSKLWDDLLDESDEVVAEAPVEEPAVVAEVVGAEPEPEVVPEVAEVVVEAVAEAPVVEMKPEVAPPAEPVVSQPPPPPPELPQLTAEQVKEWRQRALSGLEQTYALDPEAASALQVEPEKVLPRLAADLHMRIYEHVMRAVAESAPSYIQQTMQQQQSARQAEEAFYAKWGNLRGHSAQVNQVASMWRQMYPQASLSEAIDGIGKATMAMLGLSQAAPVVSPAMPVIPPTPAGPSSRTVAPRAPRSNLSPEEQQFVAFSEELLNE